MLQKKELAFRICWYLYQKSLSGDDAKVHGAAAAKIGSADVKSI